MNTSFEEIYDLALISFRDYHLDALYNISEEDFKNVLQGYLIKAIPKFKNCKKNLENINLQLKEFNFELSLTEKVILSDFMVIEWMTSQILDIKQVEMHLNSSDFKTYSEQQNLKGKVDAQNILIERAYQSTTDYGLSNIPWQDWLGGNYFGT